MILRSTGDLKYRVTSGINDFDYGKLVHRVYNVIEHADFKNHY